VLRHLGSLAAGLHRVPRIVIRWRHHGSLLKGMFRTAQTILVSRLGTQTAMRLRKQCDRSMLSMDLASFEETRCGDLMRRFTGDIHHVSNGNSLVGW